MAKRERFPIPRNAIKAPVPNVEQGSDSTCGAAALQAVCGYFGVGPNLEGDYVRDMKFDPRIGSHPHHLARTAREYGLEAEEHLGMSTEELKRVLRSGVPVVLMIQAWGDRATYAGVWDQGHWVVAIGYDRGGVYFEDPSLGPIRGYLTYQQLDDRWHDVGPRNRRMVRYGLVLRKPEKLGSHSYSVSARMIE